MCSSRGASAVLSLASLPSALPSPLSLSSPQTCPTSVPLNSVMQNHVAQLPGGGLLCLQEVTSHAPHRDPFCLIAGEVVGQHAALEEQLLDNANKLSIWLANAELHGGQHWFQLHNSPLYVA